MPRTAALPSVARRSASSGADPRIRRPIKRARNECRQAHGLEHVLIVGRGRPVRPHADRNAACDGRTHVGDAIAKAQIGPGVVRDRTASCRDQIHLVGVDPDRMRRTEKRGPSTPSVSRWRVRVVPHARAHQRPPAGRSTPRRCVCSGIPLSRRRDPGSRMHRNGSEQCSGMVGAIPRRMRSPPCGQVEAASRIAASVVSPRRGSHRLGHDTQFGRETRRATPELPDRNRDRRPSGAITARIPTSA